jgi:uncharacterized repeat protein (TIGR03803 family)
VPVPKLSLALSLLFVSTLLATCFAGAAFATGPVTHMVYTFPGNPNGYSPTSSLISDAAGNLYGTTYTGGNGDCIFSGGAAPGCGAIYEISPASGGGWTEKLIYNFEGGTDGMLPYAGLVMDAAGNLYGAASVGGDGTFGSGGTIYKLSPPSIGGGSWTFSVVFFFANQATDGGAPLGTLIFDHAGNLYGTTSGGGTSNYGTIFKLSPPSGSGGAWTETVLHYFSGTDGYHPESGLYQDGEGNLYGTTYYGGDLADCSGSGCGVVYKLVPGSGGTYSLMMLHRFVSSDGAYPYGGITYYHGDYYGTTSTNNTTRGGSVFELTPGHGGPWTFTTLHTFGGAGDGSAPYSGVISDAHGNLYGTTYGSGENGYGTAYKLSPGSGGTWNETILENFNYPASFAPIGGLLLKGSKLFGTTTDCNGGFSAGCGGYGNVFAITNF